MAVTLEFWKDDASGLVYVEYNIKVFTLQDFLQLPEAGRIVKTIYEKIQNEYPQEDLKNPFKTVGEFIEKHFLKQNAALDVVILGEGEQLSVQFQLEDQIT